MSTTNRQMFDGSFAVPLEELTDNILNDNKIVVVSIIGHSDEHAGCDKTFPLRMMLGLDISTCTQFKVPELNDTLVKLEGFYDSKSSTVFLHLIGKMDISLFTSPVQKIRELMKTKGAIEANSILQQQYYRALLFLFSVSHIVLWCHTSHILDINIITTLRALNTARNEVSASVTTLLHSIEGLNRKWATSGRLCCPRLLQLFSGHLLNDQDRDNNYSANRKSPLRVLEQSLEDQIYRLFRRNWVITNNSNNSITALPSNQQFAYVIEDHQTVQGMEERYSTVLNSFCDEAYTVNTLSENLNKVGLSMEDNIMNIPCSSISDSAVGVTPTSSQPEVMDVLVSHLLSPHITDLNANVEHRFSTFLQKHLTLAHKSGFDDNMGRGQPAPVFVLPKLSSWLGAVNKLYNFFLRPEADPHCTPKVIKSLTFETPQLQLLKMTVERAYEKALTQYKESPPRHYPLQVHSKKVEDCVRQFMNSCNKQPMVIARKEELVKECYELWSNSRRGCEQLGLLGHTCEHSEVDHPTYTSDSGETTLVHSFGVTFLKFCNCGRRRGAMLDSVALKDLNYTFYKVLLDQCCYSNEHMLLPSKLTGGEVIFVQAKQNKGNDSLVSCGSFEEVETMMTGMTLNEKCSPDSTPTYAPVKDIVDNLEEHDSLNSVERKHSFVLANADQTFLLEPMLCSNSPPNFLPDYPSWSLSSTGPSSLYSHNIGIVDQPGFPLGCNFLLAWDYKIKVNSKREWAAIASSFTRKGKAKIHFANDEYTVKIFLGMEYECFRGHRFLMSSPRTLMPYHSSYPTLSGRNIAMQAMPLYYPCICSKPNSKDATLGQLTRIHVVTPKAPVNVLLHPKVQPGPAPCPTFFPLPESSPNIKLTPGTYWVLRLPTVYVGENGPYYPPDPNQPIGVDNGCLLPGCISVSEVIVN